METLEIIEKRTNSYVIPSIDGRRRSGRVMWQIVMDTPFRLATMIRADGTTVQVEFNWGGWRVL